MEHWYSSASQDLKVPVSSLSDPSTAPQNSPSAAHAEYTLSNMSPPSSRSSRSPPPHAIAQQPKLECYTHDNDIYGYFPDEAHHIPNVQSTAQQIQYHQWELTQLISSSQPSSAYISEYASSPHQSAPHNHYSVAPYDAAHPDSDSISGYASSSSPPSRSAQISHHSRAPHHPSFGKNYMVIHQVFKPMCGDFKPYRNPHELASQQSKEMSKPHCSSFLPMGQAELGGPVRARAGTKKATKENVKRFPCPDCGRMFARAFNMETHRKTHIGYRPHSCPQCHKNFSRRHDLHRHLVAVHNDHTKIPLNASTPVSASSFNTTTVWFVLECLGHQRDESSTSRLNGVRNLHKLYSILAVFYPCFTYIIFLIHRNTYYISYKSKKDELQGRREDITHVLLVFGSDSSGISRIYFIYFDS